MGYKKSVINILLLNCNMISNKTYTVEEALLKLQNYCSYQERCHQEVRRKLVSMRMIPEAIDQIIVATKPNFMFLKKGDLIAGTRVIPLMIKEEKLLKVLESPIGWV